jgi:hypothetical protein
LTLSRLRWRKSPCLPPLVCHVSGIEGIIGIEESCGVDHKGVIFNFGIDLLAGNSAHSAYSAGFTSICKKVKRKTGLAN